MLDLFRNPLMLAGLGAAFYSFVTEKPLIDSITHFLHRQRTGGK